MLFMIGQALCALALCIVVISRIGVERPLSAVANADTLHDLGKLMLAFIMVWAYFSFSQFLIIWSGNLPEEIPWYLRRFQGGWRVVGLFLVGFPFAGPLPLLRPPAGGPPRKAGAARRPPPPPRRAAP